VAYIEEEEEVDMVPARARDVVAVEEDGVEGEEDKK